MGHNLSRQKILELERQARIADLRPLLVPGWRIEGDGRKFVEIDTVLGAWQRRQTVLLRCAAADCRRRVELNLRLAIDAGLGERRVADAVLDLRCRHWAGCEMRIASMTYPNGVPLIAYVEHPDVIIAIACAGCGARTSLTPRRVIERLRASGRGTAATGVIELGRRVRGPCRACGKRLFETSVVWPPLRDRSPPPVRTGDGTARQR